MKIVSKYKGPQINGLVIEKKKNKNPLNGLRVSVAVFRENLNQLFSIKFSLSRRRHKRGKILSPKNDQMKSIFGAFNIFREMFVNHFPQL